MRTLRYLAAAAGIAAGLASARAADPPQASQCLALAQSLPHVMYSNLRTAAADENVRITYAGHSTYVIETPGGVRIATDYNGIYDTGGVPDVVTMNRAHATHYTLNPDPRIKYVLHGWNDDGTAARHALTVGDVFIRNVPTDIRRYMFDRGDADAEMIPNGNSIFIFEVAGLCIGHLGHLHHPLTDSHIAAIGRLDIVMVPIDGTYTMSLSGMADIVRRLRSSVVLPMHRFGTPLAQLLGQLRGQFAIDRRAERTLTISAGTLPKTPTVIVLDGV
ncbi:MAG: MBL fold metallo-hydrolase [Proteobacteria bacterium]|nr:MBL fold metallo-hydrolase [Pseudomonadota bacterium]